MARAAGLILLATLTARPAGGQTRATLDLGASRVEYEGFLPSAAFSLAPALLLGSGRVGLLARGTWLRFESGNNSLQGLLSGSVRFPATSHALVELGTELGGSQYESFASFWRVLGWGRLRYPGTARASGWVAFSAGTARFDSLQVAVQSLAAAFRTQGRDVDLTLTGVATFVGDVGYGDLLATVRHTSPSGFVAEATASLRGGQPGSSGPYLEGSLTVPLTGFAGVVLAGGRYPGDAVRGNVPGQYVSAAVRFTALSRRRSPAVLAARDSQPAADTPLGIALVEVRRGRGDRCTLVFRAPAVVEVMGDFTDWIPVTLEAEGQDRWSLTLSIAPGRHRLNVRLNGGTWGVPVGTTAVADDYQGAVGTVVIP